MRTMKITAIVEQCPETGLYVGFVPGIPGAHSQGKSIDKLLDNLKEAIHLLQEDGPISPESEFVGLQTMDV